MKKTIILIMLLLVSMFAGQTLAAENAFLEASLQSYTPVPAEPGSYVTVTIKIENDGSAATKDAVIEFIDNYPFIVENNFDKIKSIGVLTTGSDYLAEFRVRIDSGAVEGTNYLKVRYADDQNSDFWIEKDIPLTVSSTQKTVSINSVKVTPEMVSPGEKANVQIKIKNLATANLRDVGVKLNLKGILVGTTYIDIPLAPIGSSIEKRISTLKSGETADFEFILQAYPEAEAGIYKVPITLMYTDDNGNEFTRVDLMSVIINGNTDVLIQVDSNSVYSDNGKGNIGFAITNKGFSEIKFLTVTLKKNDDFTITSMSSTVYVGNVDSDDYELVEFEIKMNGEGLEKVDLPLVLTFKDALNNEFTTKETLSLPLISTADAGNKKSNTGTIIVIVIVVLVVGFIIFKKKHRKKNK